MAVNTFHAKNFRLTIHLKYFPVSVLWLETDTKPLDYFQIQIVKTDHVGSNLKQISKGLLVTFIWILN